MAFLESFMKPPLPLLGSSNLWPVLVFESVRLTWSLGVAVSRSTSSHRSPSNSPSRSAFHRAMEPMWAEVDELWLALETLRAWKKAAERRGNRYLLRITLQADADLSERLEFLEGDLEAIKKADVGLR